MKIDKFVLAIIGIVFLAYLFPQWGSKESPIPLDIIGSLGISLIFFFYGLKLHPDKIKSGLKNWKLHVVVQLATFLLFPIVVLLFRPLASSEHTEMIWLAFLFLAALPSTVSSSVVMVSIANGNIPAAIFNASISGLIGIALTPLWMGMFLQQSTADFDLGVIYIKLLTEILVPVILGLLLQRFLGKYTAKYNKQLTLFDKTIILIIIYKSFSESFEEKVFTSVKLTDLLLILVADILLFFSVYYFIGFLVQKMKFNREDQITAQFCGTKKSLVHGTVFSKILFPATMPTGVILLPLMLFHAAQIFIISVIASKLGTRVDK
ncbi:bile acid:sodium symporter family protein [Flavobacterium haoranii]|uniref:Solute carrier family 10 (Sodium/bile acid cotransporter), member 7 n=1 Tax=Flavobacterium haoranii TaxID=683124 RepID=A0A1M6EDH2_9FLAO|nr:bile acid:sodium symporter family protein [Flavobacterium haoranii]SHI83525.1 solute carrier family 10 (sodium/bile acid cotransporter), member 7 [Flavobacterium haoranii]